MQIPVCSCNDRQFGLAEPTRSLLGMKDRQIGLDPCSGYKRQFGFTSTQASHRSLRSALGANNNNNNKNNNSSGLQDVLGTKDRWGLLGQPLLLLERKTGLAFKTNLFCSST
mmetsp:Transcript_44412/g.95353  ORF Transcript_44412/g.95353 Transcript_44412/m.95353 type:complete len:112 (-) Transcript_44412:79-414(-)